MSKLAIGFDIGGTKIAAAAYDEAGREVARATRSTPADYDSFLSACREAFAEVRLVAEVSVGVGTAGSANMPFMRGRDLAADLARCFEQPVAIDNDANCAALAEAIDGAGQGEAAVFGLILGTGVGGGFVHHGRIVRGRHGLAGEIGHLPLPFYEATDGAVVTCGCGAVGCLEPLCNGSGLARLHTKLSGETIDARQIAERAGRGDGAALRTLDRYYTVVAKAMRVIVFSFDPDVIVVSGGLSSLPGLIEEVPRRWGAFMPGIDVQTKFVAAKHGPMAGLRGAAWLGRQGAQPI